MTDPIAAAYAQVPAVPCKGLCIRSCGPVGMSGVEAQALQEAGIALPVVVHHPRHGELVCSHLTDAGRCAIYERRPLVCRLYGAVPEMRCPHGCMPEGGLLEGKVGKGLVVALAEEDKRVGLKEYWP